MPSDRLTPEEVRDWLNWWQQVVENDWYCDLDREDVDNAIVLCCHYLSAAADAETIKREAVREFAEALVVEFTEERCAANRRAERHAMTGGRIDAEASAEEWNEAIIKTTQLAAARGVKLKSEGGE